MIDVDGFRPKADPVKEPVKAIKEFIRLKLPEAFRGISFYWQLSSSAGHSDNKAVLKAHVWFWLDRPLTSATIKAYFKAKVAVGDVDTSLFNPVQVHYTANPVFEAGVVDPVPVRSGFVEGLDADVVDIEPGDVPEREATTAVPGKTGDLSRAF